MMIMKRAAVGLSVAVLALLVGVLALSPAPVAAQNTACYPPQGGASFVCGDGGTFVVGDGASLTVESGGTLAIEAGGTLGLSGYTTSTLDSLTVTGTGRIDGATTIGGALTVTGTSNLVGNTSVAGTFAANGSKLAVAKTLNTVLQSALTLTDGGIITPTGTFQEVTAAADVTVTLAPGASGDILIILNSANKTVTIADAGTTYLASAAALGQHDTLTLIATTGAWYEIARSNN